MFLRLKNYSCLTCVSCWVKNENHLFKEKESKLESEIANLLIKSADDFRLIEKAQQEKLEYESKLNVLNQEIQVKQNTLESEVKEKNDLLEQVKNLSQTLKYENRLKKKNEEKINNLQHLQCLDSEKIEELVTCRGNLSTQMSIRLAEETENLHNHEKQVFRLEGDLRKPMIVLINAIIK